MANDESDPATAIVATATTNIMTWPGLNGGAVGWFLSGDIGASETRISLRTACSIATATWRVPGVVHDCAGQAGSISATGAWIVAGCGYAITGAGGWWGPTAELTGCGVGRGEADGIISFGESDGAAGAGAGDLDVSEEKPGVIVYGVWLAEESAVSGIGVHFVPEKLD